MEQQVNTDVLHKQSISPFTGEYFKNEMALLPLEELSERYEKLSSICKDYDPFAGTKLSPTQEKFLSEINLIESLSNPFTFTNQALQVLDILEKELKKRAN